MFRKLLHAWYIYKRRTARSYEYNCIVSPDYVDSTLRAVLAVHNKKCITTWLLDFFFNPFIHWGFVSGSSATLHLHNHQWPPLLGSIYTSYVRIIAFPLAVCAACWLKPHDDWRLEKKGKHTHIKYRLLCQARRPSWPRGRNKPRAKEERKQREVAARTRAHTTVGSPLRSRDRTTHMSSSSSRKKR